MNARVVADALQDVGQEKVLRVEGNVQQEPGGRSPKQHPEIPDQPRPLLSATYTVMQMHSAAGSLQNLPKRCSFLSAFISVHMVGHSLHCEQNMEWINNHDEMQECLLQRQPAMVPVKLGSVPRDNVDNYAEGSPPIAQETRKCQVLVWRDFADIRSIFAAAA